jgi:hypothetical protein
LPNGAADFSGAVVVAVALVGTTVGVPVAVGSGMDGLGTAEVSVALGPPGGLAATEDAGTEPLEA